MTIEYNGSVLEAVDTPWNDSLLSCKTNEIQRIYVAKNGDIDSLIDRFESSCSASKYGFTAFRMPSSQGNKVKSALSRVGFQCIETSLSIFRDLDSFQNEKVTKLEILVDQKRDNVDLMRLVKENFHFGRFFEDPMIPEDKAIQRNLRWTESLLKADRTELLTHYSKDNLAAFMFFERLDPIRINLILGGVDQRFSHKAYPFWAALLTLLKNAGVRYVTTTISAANLPVVNLYFHYNFKLVDTLFGFHKHRL